MLYVKDGSAYARDERGRWHGVSVTVTDEVTEVRRPASVTYELGPETEEPVGAVPASVEEVVARFGVSERNPLLFAAEKAPAAKTRAQLVAEAEARGVDVPSKATKGEIEALIGKAR